MGFESVIMNITQANLGAPAPILGGAAQSRAGAAFAGAAMRLVGNRTAIILALLLGAGLVRAGAAVQAPIDFNRDVRPILSENCFVCHGPGKEDRKANLRLDVREVALEHKAIVPGNPARSKLVQHIFSTDPKSIMPPPEANKTLTAAEKETLRRWIAEGAKYEPFWAYVKPKRADPPPTHDPAWIRNPIDAFVLHKLEQKGIKPSPEADKATLLRRLSLDLIGLPPTPEEVAAFVADTSPGAYERQVDRLLASPHFGERMAVPWLDVVRFADTVGYHGDQNINIFPYRDYVINSFNEDKPFDQFTIEQLAGDLLPHPTTESRIASGFNRLNMVTREGGAQPKEYLAKYAADRVRTVSMAWLGSTMGCAECHDHKYDPFTSKDFYQMEAFFADIKQWGVYAGYDYIKVPELKGIGNDDPFPPEMEVGSPYLKRRLKKLDAQRDALFAHALALLRTNEPLQKPFETWRQSSLAFLKEHPSGWDTPTPAVTIKTEKTDPAVETNFTVQADGTVLLGKGERKSVEFVLPLGEERLAAIRLEITPRGKAEDKSAGKPAHAKEEDGKSANKLARSKAEDSSAKELAQSKALEEATLRLSASLKDGAHKTKLTFTYADADHKKERYSNGSPVLGVKGGWQILTVAEKQTAVWLLDKPLEVKSGQRLVLDLGGLPVASARVSWTPFAAPEPLDSGLGGPLQEALQQGPRISQIPTSRSGEALPEDSPDTQVDLVAGTYLLSTVFDEDLVARARKLEDRIRECRHGRAFTLVTVAREKPRITRLLPRGNWQDDSGEILQPGVPHFLPQIPDPDGRRLTRLDLGRWLVSPDNPLTARAVMNRLWKQFFGQGISAVVDDLGGQGEWPTHPELLDWLACEFMHPEEIEPSSTKPPPHDWDLKHMVKLIVMSSTYRQNSRARPDLKEIDPTNRLLARQVPRRLEAEFVRDNALFISGLLNEDIGGPSVFPYQPAGYYANLQFPDRVYQADQDDRQYRRGVYIHWQRTFLHPMLANFDAPSREECTANRVISNTPQQALTLLNDPTFVEAARVWAARLVAPAGESDAERLDRAFRRALAHPPTARERESLLKFLDLQRATYEQQSGDAAKLLRIGLASGPKHENPIEVAAWTQVCRVILNLHETITRY
jgi:Protein of unknown function (DUF1553)/Protein of unknown function (DUF1549)/Planctomycete cytochrome C